MKPILSLEKSILIAAWRGLVRIWDGLSGRLADRRVAEHARRAAEFKRQIDAVFEKAKKLEERRSQAPMKPPSEFLV